MFCVLVENPTGIFTVGSFTLLTLWLIHELRSRVVELYYQTENYPSSPKAYFYIGCTEKLKHPWVRSCDTIRILFGYVNKCLQEIKLLVSLNVRAF